MFLLWFRLLKPARNRYKLTINMIMVLNACYLYQKHIGTAFTVTALQEFFKYYDYPKMVILFGILVNKGFIYPSDFARFQLYKLTESGVKVVEGLNDGYAESLQKFCKEYNIEL